MFHGTAYQEMAIFLPFNKAADPYLDRMLLGRLDKELQARKKSADNWRIHLECDLHGQRIFSVRRGDCATDEEVASFRGHLGVRRPAFDSLYMMPWDVHLHPKGELSISFAFPGEEVGGAAPRQGPDQQRVQRPMSKELLGHVVWSQV